MGSFFMANFTYPIPQEERVQSNRDGFFSGLLRSMLPTKTYYWPADNNGEVLGATTPAPTQEPVKTQPIPNTFKFDATQYGGEIPQPNQDIAKIILDLFPNDATRAAVTAFTESGYRTAPKDMVNRNGTTDRGLFQINSDTFKDFQKRKGSQMKALGITSYDQMYDPELNAKMARLINNEQGWRAWYGPGFRGFDLSNK